MVPIYDDGRRGLVRHLPPADARRARWREAALLYVLLPLGAIACGLLTHVAADTAAPGGTRALAGLGAAAYALVVVLAVARQLRASRHSL